MSAQAKPAACKDARLSVPVAQSAAPVPTVGEVLLGGAVGLWLGLALVKFGNPAIFAARIPAPANLMELTLTPWPVFWGYWMLGGLVATGAFFARRPRGVPMVLMALPGIWFLWQVISGIHTVDAALTKPTVGHFASCALCFYLGLLALPQVHRLRLFWFGLLVGFGVVLLLGGQQHFGGLEDTRRYFFAYEWPTLREHPSEYVEEFIKKINSHRIYSTLFYPNTLAGVILLVLPILLAIAWQIPRRFSSRVVLASLAALPAGACLYWSGSKAGWIIALALAIVAWLHLPVAKHLKRAVAVAILVAGVAGFFTVYSGYFSRGAKSALARKDYWRAGWQLALERPWLGSGPGTFVVGYKRLKSPDAEMTRLAHNDYLQQAADSGILGLLAYAGFMVGSLSWLYRRTRAKLMAFSVWLGVMGLAIQGLFEFGLYIPAIAWPQFVFLGWLLGTSRNQIDKPEMPA